MLPIKLNETFETDIIEITYKGKAVSRINNFVVFLNSGVPGDRVKVKITKLKKNYANADIVSVLKSSSARVSPPCPVFNECGGCQLQHIGYQNQTEYKEIMIRDSLWHIGRISNPLNKIIPSQNEYNYRNQMQLKIKIGKKNRIGFFKENTHEIIDIENCMLQTDIGNRIIKGLKELFKNIHSEIDYDFTLIIRVSDNNKKVFIVISGYLKNELIEEISTFLVNNFPEIHCIIKDTDLSQKLIFGNDIFFYTVNDIKYKISSNNFWQVNIFQIKNLVDLVINSASLTGKETVIDAFCGAGLFSLAMAKKCRFVYGIELNKTSINDAKTNALQNNIINTKFIQGDSNAVIKKHRFPKIDIVVLDPPRKGCPEEMLEKIVSIAPEKIIYVSCDPATLSRDLRYLTEEKYEITEIQPIDMFPQTYHIETVVTLVQGSKFKVQS